MLEVWVYSNDVSYITPLNDPTKVTRQVGTKAILRDMIHNIVNESCRGEVSSNYVENFALKENNIFMVLLEIINPLAFICARRDDDDKNGFYIDVVCAKSNGKDLIKYFLEYAQLFDAKFVGLSALPTVLTFYPKLGFEFRKSCNAPVLTSLPNELTKLYEDLKKEGKKLNSNTVYDIEPYADFMLKLHNLGLGAEYEDDCNKANISKNEFKELDCSASGFKMKKCFGGGVRKTQKARKTRKLQHTRKMNNKH